MDTLKAALPSLEKARTARRIMVFPSTPDGPVHSRDAVAATGLTLERYDVTGVSLAPERAVEILPATADLALVPGGPKQGDDLRWWARVALLALSLLARGRFIPDLRDGQPVWRALVTDPADASMVDGLARAMPGSARAVIEDGEEENVTLPPRAALTAFLDAVIDGAVREDVPPPSRAATTAPGALWLKGLGADGEADLPDTLAETLERDVEAWLAPVATARGTFRAAFDLEAPPPLSEEEMVDDVAPAQGEPWTLRYYFEAADDPNLRIPMEDVWRVSEPTLRVLDRTIDNPQERALADLAVAAKEFKPIQRSLREAAPSYVMLSPVEALEFMRRAAKELEDLGFGVVLPGGRGSRRPTRPLNVTLTLRPIGKEGQNLGLGALVDYRWDIAVGNRVLTNEELDRFMRLKVPLVRVGGEWVEIREDEVRETRRYWTTRRREGLTLGEALRIQGGQSERKGGKMEVAQIEASGNLGEALLALAPSAKADDKKKEAAQEWTAPEGFQGTLRPYQERGVRWLTRLDTAGLGALLADDMGLGKTVQVLAMILAARESGREDGPTLLLCPTSVVANWEREARKFTPTLKVHVHHGGSRDKGEAFANAAQESDIVLSTYTLAVRDLEDLERVPWHRVILDEAQNIKNPETRQSLAVRRLSRAPHRIAMTGTPVENRLSELWAIMDFLNPGYLGNLQTFRKKFAIPIERLADEDAATKLRTLVRPFILRRVKTDPKVIQDLPEKIEQKIVTDLTREQAELYETVVE
ncbi:MAG TPA: DEAD/DEAH box helicase, partial [Candidatus Thermoplasmatota archaeon]|nr:DEAD/DEAH box helicase [Candidatus Thermoplasmatota archaeon]